MNRSFPLHNMTPIWIFPAYPMLLSAVFASNFIDALPSDTRGINLLAITFGAVTIQGTGFLVSLMMYGAFLYRLMSQKLPNEPLRPGMVSSQSVTIFKYLLRFAVCLRWTKRIHSCRTCASWECPSP
jgi:tellurite resistance protein TehA-like permease